MRTDGDDVLYNDVDAPDAAIEEGTIVEEADETDMSTDKLLLIWLLLFLLVLSMLLLSEFLVLSTCDCFKMPLPLEIDLLANKL